MPRRCAGVVAAACTQGKRTQHGKPQGEVRDDQPDAREGQASDREAEVHRSIERMMPGAATLQAAIGEAFSSSPTLHWSAVLHEIADGTEVGDIDVAGAS